MREDSSIDTEYLGTTAWAGAILGMHHAPALYRCIGSRSFSYGLSTTQVRTGAFYSSSRYAYAVYVRGIPARDARERLS
ncbi:hypothetical protein LMG28138_04690 [Pararobbsia alpina]|uniref:Uncharacterized protein n=1 Tax=Pararobbsia alpina TaxID=621374 RepID=A0A6S7BGG9_9BURK|nr:hypothetical protein LMG28138_04690 [Pararobbsia alpina]